MNIRIANVAGVDVSSRRSAAELRRQIIASGERCRLDFTDVLSVSQSYADELLGVLVRDKGELWLSQHVRISGASQEVKYTILEAIDARIAH